MLSVTEHPIDAGSFIAQAASPADGAVATFMGVVRDPTGSRKVESLMYEAYVPMVLKCFEKISHAVKEKWAISNLSIVHRIGRLRVGEVAVAIVVASQHRRESLEACAYAIDRVKAIAPIWKKEFYSDQESVWIEPCESLHKEAQHVHAY